MTKNEKTINQIFSALIPCTNSIVEKAMQNDPELEELLTTAGRDLPDKYRFLISEELPDWENKTLLDMILTFHGDKGDRVISNFSVAGEKVQGWVGYVVGKNDYNTEIVLNIKMCSLVDKRNPVLLRDLRDLVYDLQNDYPEIRWLALKENPANRIYKAFLDELGGEILDRGDKWLYRV